MAKKVWIYLKLHEWKNFSLDGERLTPKPGNPFGFLPAFQTYEEAINFFGGDRTNVIELDVLEERNDQQGGRGAGDGSE